MNAPLEGLSDDRARWLTRAPVGHLATSSDTGEPHVIPVCFAFDGASVYSILDQKPKRAPLSRLRRVKNIQANPHVALVVDHYEDDWQRLGYILLVGQAELLLPGDEHGIALGLLREKYLQYRDMDLEANPVIKITPQRVVAWGGRPAAIRLTGSWTNPGAAVPLLRIFTLTLCPSATYTGPAHRPD